MKKLAFVAALIAAAIAATVSVGSSHREAPLTSIDPTGDNTDTYAFTAEDELLQVRRQRALLPEHRQHR
jgi:hypothetical protein